MNVSQVYFGSDGEATKALYVELEKLGPVGVIALNLFRACKCSERAKVYYGKGYRQEAYSRKEWSLTNLVKVLSEHRIDPPILWGWREDPEQPFHKWVLYVDTPKGQVSYHLATRLIGPDYALAWDSWQSSAQRVITWCSELLRGKSAFNAIPQPSNPEPEPEFADELERWKWKHGLTRRKQPSGIVLNPGGGGSITCYSSSG